MAPQRLIALFLITLGSLFLAPGASAQGVEEEPGVEIDEEPLGKYEYDYPTQRARERANKRKRRRPSTTAAPGPAAEEQFGVGITPKAERKARRKRRKAKRERREPVARAEATSAEPKDDDGFALGWVVLIPVGVVVAGLGAGAWLRRSSGPDG